MRNNIKQIIRYSTFGILLLSTLYGQKPYRYGTTAANFLEIGVGPAVAMGEAYVSVGRNIASIYWNPAGLAFQERAELLVMNQPWVAGISNKYVATSFSIPRVGNIGVSVSHVDFGSIAVTNLANQEGTGEFYNAMEYALAFTYARSIVTWFSFGFSTKYVSSNIWHSNASAMAVDLGVAIVTEFFSPTGDQEDGLRIGMSISNYGSRMSYDGIDLLTPIDILPDENGNYSNVEGAFRMQAWDLPVIFRAGISFYPFLTHSHNLLVSMDVLHPNNNSESVNLGAQYDLGFIKGTHFFIRGGLKGMYQVNSHEELGLFGTMIPYASATYGFGLTYGLFRQQSISIDYAYKSMGLLGYVDSFSLTYRF
ncbi:MAG: PorV/PorQ family protein [Candidatus Marinimicrobia bacterium]|nr:PorV/PorQ family protein [Candidatus Neomarinimicrobiota bacterium]